MECSPSQITAILHSIDRDRPASPRERSSSTQRWSNQVASEARAGWSNRRFPAALPPDI